jgi:hypothetical protein
LGTQHQIFSDQANISHPCVRCHRQPESREGVGSETATARPELGTRAHWATSVPSRFGVTPSRECPNRARHGHASQNPGDRSARLACASEKPPQGDGRKVPKMAHASHQETADRASSQAFAARP